MRKLTDLTDIAAALTEVIDVARRMRRAYNSFPPSSKRERRRYEQRNSVELFAFEYDGHYYEAAFDTACSSTRVYAHGYYQMDGQKVTLRALTACLTKIQNESEVN